MYDFCDFVNDFENDFLGFGEPRLDFYNAGNTKDMCPAYWKKDKEDKDSNFDVFHATVRSVGIDPKDVKVSVNDTLLRVYGETKRGDDTYNFSCELPIAKAIMDNIEKIECKSENGLSYITLKVKKVDQNKKFDIEIK